MSITIRQCTLTDAPILTALGRKTFYDTCSYLSDEENIQRYMDETYSEETIQQYLKGHSTVYYCAEDDGSMIGFVKLRYSSENPKEIAHLKCLEVAQIYVDKKYQDKKVGAALINQTLKYGADGAFEVLWLSTWESGDNKALHFYIRYGFEKFSKHSFVMGRAVYEDILMKKDLT